MLQETKGFSVQVSGVRCQIREISISYELICHFVLVLGLVLAAFEPLSIEDKDEHDFNPLAWD